MTGKPQSRDPDRPARWLLSACLPALLLSTMAGAEGFDGKRYIFDKPPTTEEVVVTTVAEQPRHEHTKRHHVLHSERRHNRASASAPNPVPAAAPIKTTEPRAARSLDLMPMDSAAWAMLRAPRVDAGSLFPPVPAAESPAPSANVEARPQPSAPPAPEAHEPPKPVVVEQAGSGWKLVRLLGGGVLGCFIGSMGIVILTRRPVGRVKPWFAQAGQLSVAGSRRATANNGRRGRVLVYPVKPLPRVLARSHNPLAFRSGDPA